MSRYEYIQFLYNKVNALESMRLTVKGFMIAVIVGVLALSVNVKTYTFFLILYGLLSLVILILVDYSYHNHAVCLENKIFNIIDNKWQESFIELDFKKIYKDNRLNHSFKLWFSSAEDAGIDFFALLIYVICGMVICFYVGTSIDSIVIIVLVTIIFTTAYIVYINIVVDIPFKSIWKKILQVLKINKN